MIRIAFCLLLLPAVAWAQKPDPVPVDPALLHDVMALLQQQINEKCGALAQVAQQLGVAMKPKPEPKQEPTHP